MKTKLFFDYESPVCTMLEITPVEILCSSSASDDSTESFGNDSDYILS